MAHVQLPDKLPILGRFVLDRQGSGEAVDVEEQWRLLAIYGARQSHFSEVTLQYETVMEHNLVTGSMS